MEYNRGIFMFTADFITETDKKYSLTEQIREETGINVHSAAGLADSKRLYLLIADAESAEPTATAIIEYNLNTRCAYAGDIAVREGYNENIYKSLALRLLIYKAQALNMKEITSQVSKNDRTLYEEKGFFLDGIDDGGLTSARLLLCKK